MGDPSEGVELTPTSGECEMSVSDTNKESRCHISEPRCHISEPMGAVCLASLCSHLQPLSMETLQGAWDGLERCGELGEELGCCLDLALDRFCREPLYVQENARLLIRWDVGELEFVSGEGQCEISVYYMDSEPHYHITAQTGDVYLAWLLSHPEPLSSANLASVRDSLESCGVMGEKLRNCFNLALQEFHREPPCVQANAKMLIQCKRGSLEFLSGEGECEISVRYRDGRPHYDLGELPVHMYLDRLHAQREPLTADTLRRVWRKLVSCRGETATLRACISHALDQFILEPRCVQENAKLLIRWGGMELEFVSGQGQCEISVLLADGRPQYHITELGGDRPVTWSHTNPEPLSVTDLARVRDRLRCQGVLSEELSSCFGEAISQFSREPRCVQENARLLIRWHGQELEFVSGQGQCEISVLLADGEPQYHITALGGDRPVTWSHASPEPLSIADLVRVRDRLGRWGALGEALSGCFGEAISQFSQEPPCVQGNARMRLCWDRGSLELLLGDGECEISVCCRDGKPHYELIELPLHMYVARLRAHKDPLSADTLQRVLRKLRSCRGDTGTLRACISHALDQFSREPRCVQENARLLIRWDGQELEFVSGQGQCEISVLLAIGRPQYHITALGRDRPVTWSHTSPEPLSVTDLARVRDRLGRWGALGEELSGCFEEAISQFSQEPPCVQENARLRICWDEGNLQFLSGDGECEIFCYCYWKLQYEIGEFPVHMYVARLRDLPEPLSADTLQRVLRKLGSCRGDTSILRACISHALDQFVQDPQCVQENARLLIRWDGQELEFVSGQGQCEISVLLADGEPQYHITELGGDRPVTWSHSSPEPLSVADLARVRDRLGRWGALGEELSSCFREAISQFGREPRCVQENARLLIPWGRGELVFVSGQGQCEISVLLADGEPQYHITALGGDRPVTWSHTSPEPLSVADLARVRDRLGRWGALGEELSGCFAEAISQFSQEPPCLQENARMEIYWQKGTLVFLSGEGACKITMRSRKPGYAVGKLPMHMYLTRLRTRPEPLSADTLQRVLRKLGSCRGDTSILIACISHALDQFVQEPRCVQENARLLIRWGGQELEFVSGQGQCEISVLLADGRPQYHITELGGDRPVTWSHTSPEPLSVADLARVRDRLGRWRALGEGLSGCFREAIYQFSREPPCVQKNARMRICLDGGNLQFLSGEGECEIFMRYRDGRPQYDIGELPVHMHLARLHTRTEPRSTDSL